MASITTSNYNYNDNYFNNNHDNRDNPEQLGLDNHLDHFNHDRLLFPHSCYSCYSCYSSVWQCRPWASYEREAKDEEDDQDADAKEGSSPPQ